MRRLAFAAALCGFALATQGGPAVAQDRDVRPLLDRLDRLERDMNMLQRQVYRGGGAGEAPTASSSDTQGGLGTEVRFGQIDDQIRALTGQIEEINYNLDQLKTRLDKLSSDIDLRLTQLEKGGGAPQANAGEPPAVAGTASQAPLRPQGAGANPSAPPSQSGVLGTLSSKSGDQPGGAPPPAGGPPQQTAAAPAAAGTLPSGTPQEQYNYAFGLLRRADYPAAEQALRAFVQRYPNDALAGNAQYWLGETYYVRKDYNNAAVTFAEGYQKYPKSGKAADNLLKLAMSLGNLGQKADACRAFARLDRDFPSAPANVKEREGSEKQRIGC